jgi:hypothetical protein
MKPKDNHPWRTGHHYFDPAAVPDPDAEFADDPDSRYILHVESQGRVTFGDGNYQVAQKRGAE